jgi:hypothetical protein
MSHPMSKTETVGHTPGPWKVDETGEFVETEQPVNFRGEYWHICDFRRGGNPADARLIAAAPEMLEALARAHNDLLFMEDRDEETIDIVRAAIRKATHA